MSKKTNDKKESFTRLWGVRFDEEAARLIEEEARARAVKPGTYIRMATMETLRMNRRERLGK